MKTKTDEYTKIISSLLDEEVKYLQRKNIATGVKVNLEKKPKKDSRGNIIEFKGGTLQAVLNRMMQLPLNDEDRIGNEKISKGKREFSFYYLYRNREKALEQMCQNGIISPSRLSSATASSYIPSEYLIRHSEDVKRFIKKWIEEIPEVSTDFQCEKGFLPVNYFIAHGIFTPWDCFDSIESEKTPYFSSCIGYHGDLGSEIISLWEKLKNGFKIASEDKRQLFSQIKKLTSKYYCVKYSSHGIEPSFTPSYVKRLYQYIIGCAEEDNDTIARIEDESSHISYLHVKHPFLSVPPKGGTWLILPENGEGVGLANGGVEALDRQLLAEIKESLLQSGSQIVVNCRKNERTRLDLIEKMERLLALPKLPGICPLLKESMEEQIHPFCRSDQ